MNPESAVARDDLLEQFEDDRELLGELLETFRTELHPLMARLHSGLAAGEPRHVLTAAHRLKGSLLTFHARGAAELARAIEERSAMGTLDGLADLVSRLTDEIARALGEIDLILAE